MIYNDFVSSSIYVIQMMPCCTVIFGCMFYYSICSFLFSLYQHKEKEKRTKEKRKAEEADALAMTYLL